MAGNLTAQVRDIAEVTTAVANGDLSKKITVDVKGEILELKNTINTMVDQLALVCLGSDARRTRGGHRRKAWRTGGCARRCGHMERSDRLCEFRWPGILPPRCAILPEVTTAVAKGDLSKKISRRREGRNSRAEEHHQYDGGPAQLLRIGSDARSSRGGYGGQAWRSSRGQRRRRNVEDFTDNVNFMAGNLTSQVRGIAKVVTAVANGDLKRKLTRRSER